MNLKNRETLTLGRIADEWAKEVARQPGSLRRDEFFIELTKAYWRGAFDVSVDGAWPAPTIQFDVNRGIERFGEPPTTDEGDTRNGVAACGLHKADRTTIFCIMRSIERNADSDSEVSREKQRILERIEIHKSAFLAWMKAAGRELPKFWFAGGAGATQAPATKSKRGPKPGPYVDRLYSLLDQARKANPAYFDKSLTIIASDVRERFKRDDPDGKRYGLPTSPNGLKDAIRGYMRKRGLL